MSSIDRFVTGFRQDIYLVPMSCVSIHIKTQLNKILNVIVIIILVFCTTPAMAVYTKHKDIFFLICLVSTRPILVLVFETSIWIISRQLFFSTLKYILKGIIYVFQVIFIILLSQIWPRVELILQIEEFWTILFFIVWSF